MCVLLRPLDVGGSESSSLEDTPPPPLSSCQLLVAPHLGVGPGEIFSPPSRPRNVNCYWNCLGLAEATMLFHGRIFPVITRRRHLTVDFLVLWQETLLFPDPT